MVRESGLCSKTKSGAALEALDYVKMSLMLFVKVRVMYVYTWQLVRLALGMNSLRPCAHGRPALMGDLSLFVVFNPVPRICNKVAGRLSSQQVHRKCIFADATCRRRLSPDTASWPSHP